MTEVWIVQSGGYEDRHVVLVAASPERAIDALKERHSANEGYVVAWDGPVVAPDVWEVTGHFEHVPGLSTKHSGHYEIERWELR